MKNLHSELAASWRVALAVLACWAIPALAWADLVAPLYVGNLAPVLDPLGRTMRGSDLPGGDPVRSLTELRVSTNGLALPPLTNGAPHPFNPLLSATSIGGVGMNAVGRDSGMFCMILTDRPKAGTEIFARVFNAPTVEEATFYANSFPVTVPGAAANSVVLSFREARPIDTNGWAYPGDPFTVSHARLLGIDDRRDDDYDGDGISNWHEWLAGTDPSDPDCFLGFRLIRRATDVPRPAHAEPDWTNPIRLRWQSRPGRRYQVEYVVELTGDLKTGEPFDYIPVGDVVVAEAAEYEIEMLVDVPRDIAKGFFRIRLVEN